MEKVYSFSAWSLLYLSPVFLGIMHFAILKRVLKVEFYCRQLYVLGPQRSPWSWALTSNVVIQIALHTNESSTGNLNWLQNLTTNCFLTFQVLVKIKMSQNIHKLKNEVLAALKSFLARWWYGKAVFIKTSLWKLGVAPLQLYTVLQENITICIPLFAPVSVFPPSFTVW